eukprot:CAMPEP_0184013356 /NCGR_PEP_ID=MMETSP0954-20121128/4965_1 /TAXON_ID=627963 /ORGANISM="Aplanochytrium sp, Strain PBS07" /LENGTH=607 /DNA_ID=CAMNT_0026293531 /DNA_START=2877 /DNA_END=4701 /DNA_ORIENTATION=-
MDSGNNNETTGEKNSQGNIDSALLERARSFDTLEDKNSVALTELRSTIELVLEDVLQKQDPVEPKHSDEVKAPLKDKEAFPKGFEGEGRFEGDSVELGRHSFGNYLSNTWENKIFGNTALLRPSDAELGAWKDDISFSSNVPFSFDQQHLGEGFETFNPGLDNDRDRERQILLIFFLEWFCNRTTPSYASKVNPDSLLKTLCARLSQRGILKIDLSNLAQIRQEYQGMLMRLLFNLDSIDYNDHVDRIENQYPIPEGAIRNQLTIVEQSGTMIDSTNVNLQTILPHGKTPSKRILKEVQALLRDSRYERDFHEIAEIGSGGFGSVYKAKHKIDGQIYAVKKVRFSNYRNECLTLNPEFQENGEANHDNVVRYFASWCEKFVLPSISYNKNTCFSAEAPITGQTVSMGSTGANFAELSDSSLGESMGKLRTPKLQTHTVYIQMELCSSGITLRDWMSTTGQNDVGTIAPIVCRIVQQICNGLEHIHTNGFIHRDLKPSNIFISLDAESPRLGTPETTGIQVKIGDFGLAKIHRTEVRQSSPNDTSANALLSQPGVKLSDLHGKLLPLEALSAEPKHTTNIGTLTYAAPEQLSCVSMHFNLQTLQSNAG